MMLAQGRHISAGLPTQTQAAKRSTSYRTLAGLIFSRLRAVLLLLCLALSLPLNAASANDAPLIYTVKKGDTLATLADKYMIGSHAYRAVQKINRISNPRLLQPGKKLSIPRQLLRSRSLQGELVAFRGNVQLISNGTNSTARLNMAINEGVMIQTGANSFATIMFNDGSQLSVPSNSGMRILRARRFLIDDSRDLIVELVNGGVRSKIKPEKRPSDRLQIKTPGSVTAVRGTEFSTRYDAAGGAVLSEVYSGTIAIDSQEEAVANSLDTANLLQNGNGVRLGSDGTRQQIALLPPPALMDAGKTQSNERLAFNVDPASSQGAAAYRVEIATDASFIDRIYDDQLTGEKLDMPGIDNGRYYMRLSAIDNIGLIGMPVSYSFRRVLSGITASAATDSDGYLFRWRTSGAQKASVRLQIFADKAEGTPLVDQIDLKGDHLRLSDLPKGTYYWRTGSLIIDEGEPVYNWADFEKLIVSE